MTTFEQHRREWHDGRDASIWCSECQRYAAVRKAAAKSRVAQDAERARLAKLNVVPVQYPPGPPLDSFPSYVVKYATQYESDKAWHEAGLTMAAPSFFAVAPYHSAAAAATRNCGRALTYLAYRVTLGEGRPAYNVVTPVAPILHVAPERVIEPLEMTEAAYASSHSATEFAKWMADRREKGTAK
jgi:hypothetical protein